MTDLIRSRRLFIDVPGRIQGEQSRSPLADESMLSALGHRLISLVDELPGFVYQCEYDPGWTMIFVSDGVEPVTGHTRAQLGQGGSVTYLGLIHPEDLEPALKQVARAVEQRQPYQLNYRITNAQGQVRWVWDRGRAVYLEDATPDFLEGVVSDISEAVWSRIALRESEERFRGIIEESQDTVFLTDARGILDYVSPAAERMLGYRESEMLGEHILRLFAPDCLEEGMDSFVDTLNTGRPIRGLELLMKRKDGSSFVGEIVASRYAVGLFEGVGGTIRDVDDRKRAKREMEAGIKAIAAAGMGTIRTTAQGRILAVDDVAVRMLGRSFEELSQMTMMDIVVGLSSHDWDVCWRDLCDLGPEVIEHELRKKDGMSVPVEISATMIELQGEIYGQFLVKDVTRRREAESALREKDEQLLQVQKMESLGRLAGGVAHDYNNMLGVIMGHADLALGQTDRSSPIYEDLQQIKKAAQQSVGLTRQLLASASKQLAAPEVVDLNVAVPKLLEMLRRLVSEDVTLKWVPGSSVPPVHIDPQQLDQILTNLVINARDAVESGGEIVMTTQVVDRHDLPAKMQVRLKESDRAGLLSKLVVSDDGCGMDAAVLGSLFEPFFTTKGLGRGTGLGLSTVYGIVTQNGGVISVDSEVGVGSAFSIYLPSVVGEVSDGEQAEESAPVRGRGETVLVVEDEPAILSMTTRALESFGYSVLAAGHPEEALAIMQTHDGRVALLLTDVVMPGMNGPVLAERIKEMQPDIRCIVMSGYAADVLMPEGVLAPGVEFIQKPFSVVALADKVREVLDS